MKKLKTITALMLTFFVGKLVADDGYLPANILMMDDKFSHHVILVEKATHRLFIYENTGTQPKLIKTFSAATGKFKGNKFIEGDKKTPEGVYHMSEFLSQTELQRRHGNEAAIFGSGAFPMNYPNFIDQQLGKKGGGIWLHSTDNDNRVSKGLDSRGCVVVQNQDLKDISQYIELGNTSIVVVQDAFHLPKATWEKNRKEIHETVQTWAKAWQTKNFDAYIESYDPEEFHDKSKGNYSAYKTYKKAVFSRPDRPDIRFDHYSVLTSTDYAVVQLEQDYRSAVINDVGKKTLYLKKNDNYEWKIVGELFEKLEKRDLASFTPSKRFFKD